MRKKAFAGKQLLFALLFMGFSNFMNAHSQTNTWLVAYNQTTITAPSPGPGEQAKGFASILSDARKTFDVDFIYESSILPVNKLVVDVDAYKTVENFLDELLRPYNLKYKKVLSKAYVIYASNGELKRLLSVINKNGAVPGELLNPGSSPEAPRYLITGKITEEKGQPLEGVSVLVKGTNLGTVTGKDGSFKLEVTNANAILIFSLIGYQSQEMALNNRTSIQLSLVSQSQSLNDVVVIGYGTQKKSSVTGAISSVKSSDLENMPVTRIEQSLQGRTSGITVAQSSGQPGASSTVKIRGTTSINNSDPLYVVDGVPIDVGGIDYLNQGDIESIEVLKDGASAAIYGTRAASGVILVTTKKGKAGSLRVNYNGYYGTQAPARKLKLLDAEQYATLRNESHLAAYPTQGVIYSNPAALGKGTDWQSQIFNNDARIQNHELSLSGGTDKSTFFTSFGFFDQEGIVATAISNYKRFTARFNSTHKLKSWLNFGNNLSYSYIRSQGIGNVNSPYGGPLASAINLDPITPAVITDPAVAALTPYTQVGAVKDPLGRPYGISVPVGQEMSNPLAYIQTQLGNYGWSHNIVGNVYTDIEPISGLKFRSSIGAKLAFYGSESFKPIYYLSATLNNQSVNNFYRDDAQGLIWNWDNTLSYTRSFGLHNLSALAGTSAQKNSASDVNATYFGIPATNFDQASMNFGIPTLSKQGGGYENQPYALSSYFGRITYDYDGKYLLMAILRVDGSTRFGANNRYGKFPSVSAGWIPTREDFWPVNNAVNFLKIRASYGINGNDQSLGDFQYVSTISGGNNYTFGNDNLTTGYAPTAPANPDLKWEQTAQTDIGLDATLFKNFSLTMDVYKKKTTGMLLQVKIPGYVGASQNPYGNVADLEDKGVEIELGYNRTIGQVGFGLRGNASYNINTITNIGLNKFLTTSTFQSSSYEIGRNAVGHPLGAFYGFETLGIFQTQAEVNSYVGKSGQPIQPNAKPGDFRFADLDKDGSITSTDRTYLGDPSPHWTYGFTFTTSWKDFDLIAFGQGVSGNMIFQGLRRLDIGNANYSTAALARWTGPGTSNSFPRLDDLDPNGNFSNPSAFYLQSGAYFKIKTIQVGYTLPKDMANRMGLQKIRVYASVNNLVTLTKYTGFDPEIGGTFTAQNHGSYGVDNGIYPQARTFLAGLNVTF
jgi:TonB-dependent starch-binding outer membrane protein SusC